MILINFDGHSSKIDEINAETDISCFYPKSVPLPLKVTAARRIPRKILDIY